MKFSNQLQQIMNHFGLNTTEMADKISVPKATISHLISERNKPSLEFIMKLHTHFPLLNLEWLIYGREPFLSNEKYLIPPTISSLKTPTEICSIIETDLTETKPEEHHTLEHKKENTFESRPDIEENILSFPKKDSAKAIDSIVVFYHDGSFKRYFQE